MAQLPRRFHSFRVATGFLWAAGRRQMITMLVAQVAMALTGIGVLVSLGLVLDRLLTDDTIEVASFVPVLGLLVGVLVAGGIAAAVSDTARTMLSEVTLRQTFARMIDVTESVELASFEDPTFLDLHERVSNSIDEQTWAIVYGVTTIATGLIGATAVFVFLMTISPLLILVLFAGAIPSWYASRVNGREQYQFAYEMSPNNRERAYLGGVLSGRAAAKEVRVFRSSPHLRQRWDRLYDDRIVAMTQLVARQRRRAVISSTVAAVSTAGAAALVIWFTAEGQLSVSEVAVAMAASHQLGQRLASTLNGIGALYESTLFLQDYERLMTTPRRARTSLAPPMFYPGIRLRDVTFVYPGTDHSVLDHIDLDVPPGQLVAVVGENGSGKTTLAKLLCGLYEPTTGSARWYDDTGAEVDIARSATRTAALFQDFVCYQLPAYDNIALGDIRRFGDEQGVRRAAVEVGISDVIDALHHGWATRLSREYDDGIELSVGQWQRVAAARALFADAPFLVLDEPTAALDPRAERRLYDQLRTVAAGRTVFFISHRFSSARIADRVLVLEHGSITEDGTHDQLLAAGGTYAELFRMQATAYGLLDD